MVSGNYLSHMRFGSYTDVNHNNPNFNPAYVFALGSVTPQADMPKSGKATYSGLALASPIGGGVYEEGTSTFNVDFGTKKLNGSVSVGRWNPVSLTAKIDGNQFSGTSAEGIKPQVASMARKRPNWAACSIVKCPATMQA